MLKFPQAPRRGREARLEGLAVVVASLLLVPLAGCGPSSGKTENVPASNAAAPRAFGRTNAASRQRAGFRTNAPPAVARAPGKAALPVGIVRPATRTSAMPGIARAGAGTNAAPAAGTTGGLGETLRKLQASSAFYPAVGVIFACFCMVVLLVAKLVKAKAATAGKGTKGEAAGKIAARPARRKAKSANIHTCTVLQVGPQSRHLWQFDARGRGFVLSREQTSFGREPLPARLISKDWRSLWQRRLNVAWLPPERVFLRVAQFPASDFEETVAMVELQLEKFSPMPVAQIVWSIYIVPHAEGNLQTVVVMIVSRNEVEEFLGQLEGQGFLADRLELPLLDQLQATTVARNGAWIYPEAPGGRNAALVAWWYGGVLQNLDLITLPAANRPEGLKEQLMQMAWAGELEGWLTSPPAWHLVADAPTAAEWEPALRAGLEQLVEVIEPVPVAGLAVLTATRAAQSGSEGNLLPEEFSTRYHQQFVDRLWMRTLGAVVLLYIAGVLVYFARLELENYRTEAVEQKAAERGLEYTNSLQSKAKFQVLKDRQDLKFAALECWKVVAELLPDGVTLDGYNFNDGRKLTLSGSAPSDQIKQLLDFDADIRKAAPGGQALFDPNGGEHITYDVRGNVANWRCVLELKRSESL